jgi:hypothetical protein
MTHPDFDTFLKLQNPRGAIAKALEIEGFNYTQADIDALNFVYEVEAWRIGSSYTVAEYIGSTDNYGPLSERLAFARELWADND